MLHLLQVNEAASGAREPSQEVKRVLYDSLVRELQRKGASVPATHALLEHVVRSLGSKISWSGMAREMDVPLGRGTGPLSHQTVRDYIELLAAGYILPERLHIWQTARGGEIDFACGPRHALELVEVKYRENPSLVAASAAARAHPGRPVVMATKNTLRVAEHYTLVPVSTLLWALG